MPIKNREIADYVPRGGLAEWVLSKLSSSDYDYIWAPPVGGSGVGESRAMLFLDSDIVISDNASIPWDSEDYDVGGWHDPITNPERLTVPLGVSRIVVGGNVEISDPDTQLIMRVFRNDLREAILPSLHTQTSPTGTQIGQISSGLIDAIPGDYFTLNRTISSGADQDVIAANTNFWIYSV